MMMAIAWNKLSQGQSLHISRCGYKSLQFETSCDAQAVHDLVLGGLKEQVQHLM